MRRAALAASRALRMLRRTRRAVVLLCLALGLGGTAFGQGLIDQPGFESGYQVPEPPAPAARWAGWEYVDLGVLAAALALASYLALKRRSRPALVLLMIFCLAYFGFYRGGCVCPIGAIQNVTLALFDGGYTLPLVVLGFFLLPLVFTLLFGRVFCAAVCPLGGIQDLVAWRPVKVPAWAQHALGLLAWVYLAVAVLMAATGSAFAICRYDPFVGLFRLSGDVNMLILGACFLVVGVFVARPYCRFLCPLGAIMRPLSCVSKYHVTITPDECIKCRLCEDTCPFGAIRKPTTERAGSRSRGRWTLAAMLVLLPGLVLLGGWGGLKLAPALAEANYQVRLADLVRLQEFATSLVERSRPGPLERAGLVFDVRTAHGRRLVVCRDTAAGRTLWQHPLGAADAGPRGHVDETRLAADARGLWVLVRPNESSPAAAVDNLHSMLCLDPATGGRIWAGRVPLVTDESKAFRESHEFRTARRPEQELYADLYARAGDVRRRFEWGGAVALAFVALVIGLKLIQLAVRRTRSDYTADRATCLACGRCFKYCPKEQERRKARRHSSIPIPPRRGGSG